MTGKICPKCGKQTLWDKGANLECSACGYKEVTVSSNDGMGGNGGNEKDTTTPITIRPTNDIVIMSQEEYNKLNESSKIAKKCVSQAGEILSISKRIK